MSIEPRTRTTPSAMGGHEPANLGDILERVLDRGVVIVGDIRISLLDIELLTVKLRLLIASVDTARELGIDWWQHDPWLSSHARSGVPAGSRLRTDVAGNERRAVEADDDGRAALPASEPSRSEFESNDEVYPNEDRAHD